MPWKYAFAVPILLSLALTAQPSNDRGYPFAIWLIPSEPHRTALEREMWQVADYNNLPRFRPHVTLVTTRDGAGLPNLQKALEDLLETADKFAQQHGPLQLTAESQNPVCPKGPNDWSISVYAPFQLTDDLTKFFHEAEQAFPQFEARQCNGKYMPHLSLAY